MRFFLRLAAVFAVGLSVCASAQTTNITAASGSLKMGGVPIASGVLTITPVSISGAPIAFVNSGLNSPDSFSCTITGGGLSGCSVPDACLSSPANFLYTMQIVNRTSQRIFTMTGIVGVCGTSWALDAYAPPATTTNVQPVQTSHGTGAYSGSCVEPSFYTRDDTGELDQCVGGTMVPVSVSGGTYPYYGVAKSLQAIPGSKLAVYDFTRAVSGTPVPDQLGVSPAITWPGSGAPTTSSSGLVFSSASNQCLPMPSGLTGAVGVSVYYIRNGEDYQGNNPDSYPKTRTLFSGSIPSGGGAFSAVNMLAGLGSIDAGFYYPEMDSNSAFTDVTTESYAGAHMITFIVGSPDSIGIDDHYLLASSYASQGSSTGYLASPYALGCAISRNGFYLDGTVSHLIVWTAAPTATQLASAYATIKNLASSEGVGLSWGAPMADNSPTVACVGDSHTSGTGATTYCSSTNMPLLSSYSLKVLATSGKHLAEMVPELPYELYKNVSPLAPQKVVILDGGTNDFGGDTVQHIEGRYVQAAVSAHQAGVNLIIQTYFSNCINGVSESTVKNTLNAWIRANWRSFADGISDVAANTTIGKDNAGCTDSTNFDGSHYHLTNAGKAIEGTIPQAAVLNLYGSTPKIPTTVTATASIVSGQNYINAACSSACTLTLPDAATNAGASFTVHAVGSGAVSVARAGSDTIDGGTSAVSISTGATAIFISIPSSNTATAGASWSRE